MTTYYFHEIIWVVYFKHCKLRIVEDGAKFVWHDYGPDSNINERINEAEYLSQQKVNWRRASTIYVPSDI